MVTDDETQTTSRRGPTIRPLCPTRWVMRHASLDSILCNYERIVTFLDEIPEHSADAMIRMKAAGLLTKAEEFQTLFGLRALHELFASAQPIHKYMQSPQVSVSQVKDLLDMLDMEYALKAGIRPLNVSGEDAIIDKSVQKEETFYMDCMREAEILDIHPPLLLTSRADKRIARNDSGNMPTAEDVAKITKSWCTDKYIQMDDTASNSIRTRYDRNAIAVVSDAEQVLTQPGVDNYMQLDNVMAHWGSEDLGGCAQTLKQNCINFHDYLLFHPEKLYVNFEDTSQQSRPFDISKFHGIVRVMRQCPAMRDMYPVMTALVRLRLVIPATSCESERSFSALRRLKTYRRCTMAQERLCNLALCQVHKHKLDDLDLDQLMEEWIGGCAQRMNSFGGVGPDAVEAARARKQAEKVSKEARNLVEEASKEEERVKRKRKQHEAGAGGSN